MIGIFLYFTIWYINNHDSVRQNFSEGKWNEFIWNRRFDELKYDNGIPFQYHFNLLN